MRDETAFSKSFHAYLPISTVFPKFSQELPSYYIHFSGPMLHNSCGQLSRQP